MPTISARFEIPGLPVAKARPRFNSQMLVVYDKQKVFVKRDKIILLKQLVEKRIASRYNGKMTISMTFYFPMTKTMLKRPVNHFIKLHDKKPDVDNLMKYYLDVMNQVVYKDDCKVCHVEGIKFYDEVPRTIIEVHYLG